MSEVYVIMKRYTI